MAEKFLTIKEFAERVGVTPQAVYLRLDKDLKPFLEMQAGRKVLSSKALEHFFNKEPCQESSSTCKASSDPLMLQVLKEQLETLQGQLSIKDKQIEGLNEALQNEQKLHAAAVQQLRLLQEVNEQPEEAEPQPEAEPTAWELFKQAWHKTWFN